jgi:hypothetical protein
MVKKTTAMDTGATSATRSPVLTGIDLFGVLSGNTNDGTDLTSGLTGPPGVTTIQTEGVIDGPNNTSFQTDDDVK